MTGTFKSDDMDGGSFLTGRYSEGFSGDPTGVGNGAHAGSWDGANLYSEWELQGPLVATATVVWDDRVAGTGTVMVVRTFDLDTLNASLTLGAGGPWDGGDGPYTVDLDYYIQQVSGYYVNFVLQDASSNETFTGDFVSHPGFRLSGQADGAYVGQGASLPDPNDWPSWIPAGTTVGSWGEVGLVRFTITPEPATLLLVGLGVAGLVGRRRKR